MSSISLLHNFVYHPGGTHPAFGFKNSFKFKFLHILKPTRGTRVVNWWRRWSFHFDSLPDNDEKLWKKRSYVWNSINSVAKRRSSIIIGRHIEERKIKKRPSRAHATVTKTSNFLQENRRKLKKKKKEKKNRWKTYMCNSGSGERNRIRSWTDE